MKKIIYLFGFLMCMFITSCSTTLCYSRIEVFNDNGELVDTFITTRSPYTTRYNYNYTDRSDAKSVAGHYVSLKNMAIQYPSTYTIKSTLKVTKKDKSKNITDIYMISDRLENLYDSVSNIKARKLLNDRLVYIRLLAFGMQNEYDKKNSFSRTKIFNKSVKMKNKFKTLLYIISPKFYFMILKLKRGE